MGGAEEGRDGGRGGCGGGGVCLHSPGKSMQTMRIMVSCRML